MSRMMIGWSILLTISGAGLAGAETITFPLDSLQGLTPHNVRAEPVVYRGRAAIRVTQAADEGQGTEAMLVLVAGTEFHDGTIEIELAGTPAEGAPGAARGFVGVAFRVAADLSRFECIYLRPTNGRADDQVRRNHSVQYTSFPDFPWFRLREETPGAYETYVDLVPGEWTKVRIEVSGERTRLYVHGAEQPTLLVNDLKLGSATGPVALWIGPGTEAHFTNLRVTREQ